MKENKKTNTIEKLNLAKEYSRWLWKYGKKQFWLILLYTILGMSSVLVSVVSSFASKDMVDIVTGKMAGELIKAFFAVVISQAVSMIINQLSGYSSAYISTRINNEMKEDVYDTVMSTKWEYINQYDSGYITARWSGDTSVISSGMLSLVSGGINAFLQFFVALKVMVSSDATFIIFTAIAIPLGLLVSKGNMVKSRDANEENMRVSGKMSLFITESFSNTHTVKSFGLENRFANNIRKLNKEYLKVTMKSRRVDSANSMLLELVQSGVSYLTLGWGIYRVWTGNITYGEMTLLIGMSSSLSSSAKAVVNIVPRVISLFVSVGRIVAIEKLPKEDFSNISKAVEFANDNSKCGIGVYIKDKNFSYLNGNEVLSAIDFCAKPGEVVGLIGPSGEGKTTLLRVLLSLVYSDSGVSYLFAGDDYSTERRFEFSAAIRHIISYVPQGNTMFPGTIAENMRDVKENATDEEIIDALQCACAWEFVSKLPDGINSTIKQHGIGFSEGQAQRLSIARAMLKDSPVMLLDEATSALDIDTANRVLNNILQFHNKKTIILTTHRPEVRSLCGRVYVINNGEIKTDEAK